MNFFSSVQTFPYGKNRTQRTMGASLLFFEEGRNSGVPTPRENSLLAVPATGSCRILSHPMGC